MVDPPLRDAWSNVGGILFISINVFCWRTASTNQITDLTLPAMKIFFHYTPLELLIGLKIIRVYETAKAN